jgi:hypothetical protein
MQSRTLQTPFRWNADEVSDTSVGNLAADPNALVELPFLSAV